MTVSVLIWTPATWTVDPGLCRHVMFLDMLEMTVTLRSPWYIAQSNYHFHVLEQDCASSHTSFQCQPKRPKQELFGIFEVDEAVKACTMYNVELKGFPAAN